MRARSIAENFPSLNFSFPLNSSALICCECGENKIVLAKKSSSDYSSHWRHESFWGGMKCVEIHCCALENVFENDDFPLVERIFELTDERLPLRRRLMAVNITCRGSHWHWDFSPFRSLTLELEKPPSRLRVVWKKLSNIKVVNQVTNVEVYIGAAKQYTHISWSDLNFKTWQPNKHILIRLKLFPPDSIRTIFSVLFSS